VQIIKNFFILSPKRKFYISSLRNISNVGNFGEDLKINVRTLMNDFFVYKMETETNFELVEN